jgi:putative transcriptional regulator
VNSKVRELRKSAGLSQESLARAVGVSRQTINAIEASRYDPSLKLAVHLARYFNSTVEEIFDVDAS